MQIKLTGIGKKFSREWIFRDVQVVFPSGSVSAILGRNGSGKSTLLQVIAGNLTPTEGSVTYEHQGSKISGETIFRHLTIAAPYLDLVEDFTLSEMIRFHFSFKPCIPDLKVVDIPELIGLDHFRSKHILNFSSGMKQRVKLGLAIFSDVPMILLDEPTMNLDQEGIAWYHHLLSGFRRERTVIICSNLPQVESSLAGQVIKVEDYKVPRAATK